LLLVRLYCVLELREFLLLSQSRLDQQRELGLVGLLECSESLLGTKLELVHSSLLHLDPRSQVFDQDTLFRRLLVKGLLQRFDVLEQFRFSHAALP
jgi:hypothetical protein